MSLTTLKKLNLNNVLQFKKEWTLLAALLMAVASYFIKGPYHPDEHYQILEFAHMKLFNLKGEYLPWEFKEKMRSWFQPWLFTMSFKFFQEIGIESPFTWVTLWRLFNAWMGLLLNLSLFRCYESDFKSNFDKAFFFLSSLFLWVFPFLYTRTSSENMGGHLFVGSYLLFMRARGYEKNLLVGVLFGICFLMRFHFAVSIFFLCLWALLFKYKNITSLFFITLMCLLTIGLGAFFDYWGYGDWLLSFYNYYYQNIVQGMAATFGTSPWWRYFYEAQKELFGFIGVPTVLSFIYFWVRYWHFPMTWATLGFFLFHSSVGHKELRFLFPLVAFIPYVLTKTLADLKKAAFFKKRLQILNKAAIVFLLSNFFIFIFSLFRPAHRAIDRYQFLYQNKDKIKKIYYNDIYPPSQIGVTAMKFYQIDNIDYIKAAKPNEVKEREFYFSSDDSWNYYKYRKKRNCKAVYPAAQ